MLCRYVSIVLIGDFIFCVLLNFIIIVIIVIVKRLVYSGQFFLTETYFCFEVCPKSEVKLRPFKYVISIGKLVEIH